MLALAGYRTGFDALADYILRLAENQPTLVDEVVEADDLGPLVAEALVAMSAEVHPPDDQATYRGRVPKLGEDEARALLNEAEGNVTVAAQRAKVSRATLYRALGRGK